MANKKKKSKVKVMLIYAFIIILIIGVSIVAVVMSKINNVVEEMDIVEIVETNEELEITEKVVEKVEEYDITNFAFFGIDTRSDEGVKGRSDAIMVVSIDKESEKIKLSSIMRDTYVDITGHGMDKITHAYAFGGPQLAIATINKNFGLNIENFATVNFHDLEEIIDALGGVTIELSSAEANLIKGANAGTQNLNGKQAVSYSRIRYLAGGDYVRTERQREVLTALLNKISSMNKAEFVSVVPELAKHVTTNMNVTDMISMGVDALQSGIKNIDTERFPVDGNAKGDSSSGIYYLKTDLNLTTQQIFDFIYRDIKPSTEEE